MEILHCTHDHGSSRECLYLILFVHKAKTTIYPADEITGRKEKNKSKIINNNKTLLRLLRHTHTHTLTLIASYFDTLGHSIVCSKLLFSQFTWLFLLFVVCCVPFCVALLSLSLSNDRKWHNTLSASHCLSASRLETLFREINFHLKLNRKLIYPLCVHICDVAVTATRLLAASFVELISSTPQQNKRQFLFSVHDKSRFSFHMENVKMFKQPEFSSNLCCCLRQRQYGFFGLLCVFKCRFWMYNYVFWCPVTTVSTTTTTTTDDDDDDANHLRNENWQFLRIASQPRCPIEEHCTNTVHKRTHTHTCMLACKQTIQRE